MIPPIFPLLSASSAVTAIVGTSPARIYPAGNIPQSATQDPNVNVPCVTWRTVGGHAENILSDRPGVDNQRVQLDCWALTFTQAQTLATAVQYALELVGNCVAVNGSDFEADTKRYRVSFDFSFWLGR